MKKNLFTASLIVIALASCKTKEKTTATKAPAVNCTNTAYTYEADIKPIMDQNCLRCHNTNMKAGYNFGDVESVKRAGSNGYLLGTIQHLEGYMPMPAHAEKMDQASIDKIECWVKNGMK